MKDNKEDGYKYDFIRVMDGASFGNLETLLDRSISMYLLENGKEDAEENIQEVYFQFLEVNHEDQSKFITNIIGSTDKEEYSQLYDDFKFEIDDILDWSMVDIIKTSYLENVGGIGVETKQGYTIHWNKEDPLFLYPENKTILMIEALAFKFEEKVNKIKIKSEFP